MLYNACSGSVYMVQNMQNLNLFHGYVIELWLQRYDLISVKINVKHATTTGNCMRFSPPPPKRQRQPRFWFAREARLISANTGANIETGPLLTHLSQCESCVMIWVVWMAVCLDLLRCRVPGWVRGRERWSLAAGECFLYHDSINRHHLLWQWRKVGFVGVQRICIYNSAATEPCRNSFGTSLQMKPNQMVIGSRATYIMI